MPKNLKGEGLTVLTLDRLLSVLSVHGVRSFVKFRSTGIHTPLWWFDTCGVSSPASGGDLTRIRLTHRTDSTDSSAAMPGEGRA